MENPQIKFIAPLPTFGEKKQSFLYKKENFPVYKCDMLTMKYWGYIWERRSAHGASINWANHRPVASGRWICESIFRLLTSMMKLEVSLGVFFLALEENIALNAFWVGKVRFFGGETQKVKEIFICGFPTDLEWLHEPSYFTSNFFCKLPHLTSLCQCGLSYEKIFVSQDLEVFCIHRRSFPEKSPLLKKNGLKLFRGCA